MRIRTLAVTATAAALAAVLTPSGPTEGTATAAPSRPTDALTGATNGAAPKDDFNGDGYADLAVGMPKATVDGRAQAGYVNVVWGGPDGLGTAGSARVSQSTSGVPGTAEAGDLFGTSVSAADLNGDGYSDLAVTAPGERLTDTGTGREGTAVVVWGSPSGFRGGLTAAKGRADERLGRLLTAGDFDRDGHQDLALSIEGEEGGATVLRRGPFTTGSATDTSRVEGYAFGSARALVTGDFDGDGGDDLAVTYKGMEIAGTHVLSKASGEWKRTWTTGDFGGAIATGDFDGDGTADLAIGQVQPNPETDGTFCEDRLGGAVAVVYGKRDTTLGGTVECTTQSSPYVPGTAEPEDNFGGALATGDLDLDGRDELVVGVSHEAIGTEADAGAYLWLAAGPDGSMTGVGFNQNSTDVAGTAEAGDLFGAAVATGDYNGDRYPDMAIGAPGENAGSGGVWFDASRDEGTQPPVTAVTPARLGLSGAVEHGGVLAR
ncbi:FG-GAP and VCBS repeat-containing protein [Streptomyces sparsogenes]|uniref:Integrin-like protein n=1 Tax=Streptomyces sparsogenes DSM 40356 TaxID=1331668 RepID=A0A1R1S9N8_9ACTN|nr:FG-GAP and VCBS repeat-containing protein [Streptomyces sparsogenes]OMI34887.1 integrin-like protein [Streptomyces sparsogenes DSM 40356]